MKISDPILAARGCVVALLLVATLTLNARANQVTVQLRGSATAGFLEAVQSRLSDVLTAMSEDKLGTVSQYFTNTGRKQTDALQHETKCRPTEVLYQTNLLILPEGEYEVRDIRVEQGISGSETEKVRYLVFTLTRQGLISDVRFALESHLVPEVVRNGTALEDAVTYNKIIDFIEVFRTAYNRKDLDYISQVYSDSALIIVGHIVKNAPRSDDPFSRATLTGDKIKFVRFSKKQYLENLSKAFRTNSYISIDFENIEILKHPLNSNYFGVMLEQSWKSSAYSDHGYLFMMFDFTDENRPMIHVRSWQPEKFADGTVVGLGDFLIMPKASAPGGDSTNKSQDGK